jgi:tetratricopeptide (TPR) repeat protein
MKREILNSFILVLITVAMTAGACGGSKKKKSKKGKDKSASVEERAEQFMAQAGLALHEGDEQQALANYLAAAEVYDKEGKVSVERAEAHFLAAGMAYQISERMMAIEEYDEAVKIYLRFGGNSKMKAANALNNMGTIYKELQDKSKAANCWNRALQIYEAAPPEQRNTANMQKIQQNLRDLQEGF